MIAQMRKTILRIGQMINYEKVSEILIDQK